MNYREMTIIETLEIALYIHNYYAKGLVVVKCFLSIIHRFYKKTYRSIA